MNRILTACVVGSLWAGSAFADDADVARATIEKAIQAAGGEENLTRFNAQTWKETGKYYGMGDALPYTGIYSIQWPGQFKMEIEGVFTIVLNNDKGWVRANGETRVMTGDELASQREDHFGGWIATLLPLRDKAFKLSTLAEIKVGDRAAVGVLVRRETHRDVKLFFDKENGLLLKSENIVVSPEQGNKEVLQESYSREYQTVEGAKIATKHAIHREGKLFVEGELFDVKAAGKLNESVFAKPE